MSKFVKVEDPSHLIPAIEERLPESCYMINQLKSYDQFKDDLQVFSYGENNAESLWLVTKFHRDDYGLWLFLLGPSQQYCAGVPEEVTQSILSGKIFSWEEKYFFCGLQPHVYRMMLDLSLEVHGNIISIYPCYLFHMTPEEALQLDVSPPSGIQVKRLHPGTGTPFITNNWHYSKEGTSSMVRKGIERLPSVGVYVDGSEEPVCGAITPGFGLMGMLHTDPEHRRKGYASLAMRFVFKEMAKEGLQPCLIAEMDNKTAVNFHRNFGLSQITKIMFFGNGVQ